MAGKKNHKEPTEIASEGRDARSANNTIQAIRRSVVMTDWCEDLHLGEMRHSVYQIILRRWGKNYSGAIIICASWRYGGI